MEHSGNHGATRDAVQREELAAEIADTFVCVSLGIVPTVRHADCVVFWLEVPREDNRVIVRTAGAASNAADVLLALLPPAIEIVAEGSEEAA